MSPTLKLIIFWKLTTRNIFASNFVWKVCLTFSCLHIINYVSDFLDSPEDYAQLKVISFKFLSYIIKFILFEISMCYFKKVVCIFVYPPEGVCIYFCVSTWLYVCDCVYADVCIEAIKGHWSLWVNMCLVDAWLDTWVSDSQLWSSWLNSICS